MKKATLVLLPATVTGHLKPMIGFAKLLLQRYPNLSITMIIMTTTANNNSEESHLRHLPTATTPSITFLHLPLQPLVNHHHLSSSSSFSEFVDHNYQAVSHAITTLAHSPRPPKLAGLVVDMVCTRFVDLGQDLHLPTYLFFTYSANFLGFFLNFNTLVEEHGLHLTEEPYLSDLNLTVSSFHLPLPASVLPKILFDKDGRMLSAINKAVERMGRMKAIVVNTFQDLEPYAMQSFIKGTTIFPPVCAVGPLLDLTPTNEYGRSSAEEKITRWLDLQPDSSVVFLCFGSRGSFPPEQVKEIAQGVELSGYRFLWSLRRPPDSAESGGNIFPTDYTEPKEALDGGFLERTAGTGMVIGWAPQTAVLGHRAVGGFVSHCGWNSVLESVWCGVPVAALPLYAEQEMNAFFLVEEMGLGKKIPGGAKGEEVAEGIRSVMEDGEVREKMMRIKWKAREAVVEGGSSYLQLGNLIEDAIMAVL